MNNNALGHYIEAEKQLDRALSDDPDCAEEFLGMLRNHAAKRIIDNAKQRAWRLQALPGDSRSYP